MFRHFDGVPERWEAGFIQQQKKQNGREATGGKVASR
jgi:hypothetical protein